MIHIYSTVALAVFILRLTLLFKISSTAQPLIQYGYSTVWGFPTRKRDLHVLFD